MSSETLIELGEDRTPPQTPARQRREVMRSVRKALAGAACLVLLGALGGSALPAEPMVSLVAIVARPSSIEVGNQVTIEGGLILIRGQAQTTAYDLHGEPLWSTASIFPPRYVEPGYFLFVTATEVRSFADPEDASIIIAQFVHPASMRAVEPLTGAELWRADTFLEPVGDLLAGEDGSGRLSVYQGLPPRLLWQGEPMRATAVDPVHRTAYGLTKENLLVAFDLTTGEVIRHREVATVAGDGWLVLTVMADRIFLARPDYIDKGVIAVFDRQTLAPVEWGTQWRILSDCGSVVCASDFETGQWGAADKITGELLWSVRGRRLVASPAGLLAVLPSGNGAEVSELLDPLTGAVRAPLSGWHVVGLAGDGETEFLVRPQQDRSQLAVLDSRGPRVIGTMPYQVRRCYSDGRLVVCDVNNGDLGVWRLNRRVG